MKRLSRIFALTLAAILMLAIALPAFAAYTNTTQVALRASPSSSGTIIGRVANGTQVTVHDEVTGTTIPGQTSTKWYWLTVTSYVSGGDNLVGRTGYMHESVVSGYGGGDPDPGGSPDRPAIIGPRTQGYVSTSSGGLNIRESVPNGRVLVEAARHSTIFFYRTTNSAWHYVEYTHTNGNHYTGYASSSYITAGTGSVNEKETCKLCGARVNYWIIVDPGNPYVPGPGQYPIYHTPSGGTRHSCDYKDYIYWDQYQCPNYTTGSQHTSLLEYRPIREWFCGVIE